MLLAKTASYDDEGEELDAGGDAGRRGQPAVAGDERGSERLGERDEHRVVGGEVMPQVPRAVAERVVGVARQGELR